MVSSTTLAAGASGVKLTWTPRSRAASRSTESRPTPTRAISFNFGARSRTARVIGSVPATQQSASATRPGSSLSLSLRGCGLRRIRAPVPVRTRSGSGSSCAKGHTPTKTVVTRSNANIHAMAYTLVVQDGPGPERVYVLEKDATVGRDRACDVVLGAGGVSRKHCVLERTRDGGVVLRDLGSKNGTFVNGERVEKAKLREGDKLGVGEASLRVEALKAQDEPTTDATTRELSRPKDSPPEGAVTFLAESPEAKQVLRLVEKAAPTDSTVLVTGESGTGKEVEARLLHARSPRRSGAFVDVNCGALAPTLVDAELFGHEKGAFTGADKRREGKLELALGAQVKLLRVLEERRLVRVGGKEDVPVDFRLVAATHRDLEQLVKEGKFRQDLFYRLEVIRISVPPLRVRREDVLPLARLFLARMRQRTGRSIEGFAPEAEKRLL